jgi:hypothetical protein
MGMSMRSTIYEFRVDGRLPENSAEAFCGMFVEEVPAGIILRGAVIDEPHLLGVINQLGVLGLSIVSVHPVTSSGHTPMRPVRLPYTTTVGPRRKARRLRGRTKRRGDSE